MFRDRGLAQKYLRPTNPPPSQRIVRRGGNRTLQIGIGALGISRQELGQPSHSPPSPISRPPRTSLLSQLSNFDMRATICNGKKHRRHQTLRRHSLAPTAPRRNPAPRRSNVAPLPTRQARYTGHCRIELPRCIELRHPPKKPIDRMRPMQRPHPQHLRSQKSRRQRPRNAIDLEQGRQPGHAPGIVAPHECDRGEVVTHSHLEWIVRRLIGREQSFEMAFRVIPALLRQEPVASAQSPRSGVLFLPIRRCMQAPLRLAPIAPPQRSGKRLAQIVELCRGVSALRQGSVGVCGAGGVHQASHPAFWRFV